MANTLKPQPVVIHLLGAEPEDQVIVREKIMDVIKRRLSRITIDNGYSCDCGTNVQEGKIIDLQPPIPSMNVWDGSESSVRVNRSEQNTVRVTIEMYEEGDENSTSQNIARQARRMAADARKAIAWNDSYEKVDPSFDGIADGLKFTQSDLVLGFHDIPWIGVLLDFEVTYYTLTGNQFRSKE